MKEYNIEISSLHEDLEKYGTIIGAYNNIAAKVVSLTSEYNALSKKVEGLREEQRRISDIIEFQVGEGAKAFQTFLNNLDSHIKNASKPQFRQSKVLRNNHLPLVSKAK